MIGDKIAVTVVRIGQGGVRIGIEAPDEFLVVREELKQGDAAQLAADADKSRIGAPR